MIHEIDESFDNVWRQLSPRPDDRVICLRDDGISARCVGDALTFPTVAEADRTDAYLFSVDGCRFFAGAVSDPRFQPLSGDVLRRSAPRWAAFAGVTGLHLCRWYRDHRFCGRCGRPMRHSETERAMVCDCGNTVYPQICPAVIVGVLHGDRICLTRYNRKNARWALVAGYTEIGETAEETVRREVLEETGLRVKNIVYYKSQPWGFSGSLLLGYFCEADGGDPRADGVELKDARWFTAEQIDFPDDGVSMTREMIEVFRSGSRRNK